jgi:hypothetical protein
MKTIAICVLSAVFGLTSSVASASDPTASAKTTVERSLTEPLARQEARRSRFSRVAIPARTRTVRILDERARQDLRGSEFFAFSIDERHGWHNILAKDAITGCVYPKSGDVFVKRGDSHYPVGLLLGQTSKKAEAHVCVESSDGAAAATAQPVNPGARALAERAP